MQAIEYPQFGETLYTETLANGLKVNLLSRPDFHRTYGVITANYGSNDTTFVPVGQSDYQTVPAGIAHFLEHKLFEKEDYDAFEIFGKYGADSNAFTSFTRTSYLFSATRNVNECVCQLLDFVQDPYFTEETVVKEKGIIGQEIKMYDDDPGWRLFFGILGNLYPNQALSVDIAGSVDSIAQITPADLYTCYQTFYQPGNMNLFIVGNFEVEAMLDLIKQNQAQKTFPAASQPQVAGMTNDAEVLPYRMLELDVNQPKVMVGIKGIDTVPQGREALRYRLQVEMLLHLLYSENSAMYTELYDREILDDSFGYNFQLERGFHLATINGGSYYPNELADEIIKTAKNALEILDHQGQEFDLAKREFIGHYLQALNSLESIANSYEGDLYDSATLLDYIPIIEAMTLDDIKQVAQSFLGPEVFSVFQILPKGGQEG